MEPPVARWRALVPGLNSVLCVLLAAPLLLTHALLSEDTWWHLNEGAQTLRGDGFPLLESDSFTAAGTPLVSHSWLFDAAIAALERAGGLGLVEVAGFLLVALTF